MEIKIESISLNRNTSEGLKTAVEKRKESGVGETLEEAFSRIYAMKNTDADRRKIAEVERAILSGEIGREKKQLESGKKLSKAEVIRLWNVLEDRKKEERIRHLIESKPDNYFLVSNARELAELKESIEQADIISVDCETFGEKDGDQFDPYTGKMAGFSITANDRHYYVPLNHTEKTELSEDDVFSSLKVPLESTPNVMHNAPFDAKFFYVRYGIDLITNLYADTNILSMALNENISHKLKDLAHAWLKLEDSYPFDKLFSKGYRFNEVPLDAAVVYAAGDTEKTQKLYDWMMGVFDSREDLSEIKRLVFDVEMPVCRTFIRADLRGIGFDPKKAIEVDRQFEREVVEIEKDIHRMVGEINLNSPKQLQKTLFGELGLPDLAKGSTKSDVLEKLTQKHPIVPKIIEHRKVTKLRSSFTQPLPKKVKADGKIHPSHNSWGAVTGRFTCKDPNTQQMPSNRNEIRHLFLADPGRILIGIDYSQIELRVLAHLANDPVLIRAFKEGRDIHSTTAAQITGIPYEQIEERKDIDGTKEQKARKNAKPVNFGIAYGITSVGLANQLNTTKQEAQKIIDSYFKGYPNIKRYMDEQVRMARTKGYVLDMFGRKRRLANQYRRGFTGGADRQAGNFPIQSSAGTILKKAVVALEPILPELNVNISLQIHDELLFDCPASITSEEVRLIVDTMENAHKLVVPLKCDAEIYPNRWAEKVEWSDWFKSS
ncbi:DNA polymerase [Halalkalibacterium halodurans]|uniref:DNA polymerase n=1 Tax=Halalkalibacterium halodurans TaxID=86665 RepID=UPI002E1A75E4|nr:DNA polymerase [Halalkalibacterium halodurans]MED4172607.1 DNA polymerase [Halalkalibacterium halodurans]